MASNERKAHEKALLAFYLDSLREHLRDDLKQTVPSFEDAWCLYAQSMAWGLVIGWLMCPPANYGKEIWLGNVNRLVAACSHLDTFKLLDIHRK